MYIYVISEWRRSRVNISDKHPTKNPLKPQTPDTAVQVQIGKIGPIWILYRKIPRNLIPRNLSLPFWWISGGYIFSLTDTYTSMNKSRDTWEAEKA